MKSFYEMMQILLKENEQGRGGVSPTNQLRTGEERRRHFGIKGTGGGRTDDEVIYNDLKVDYEGYYEGKIIIWFEDHKDFEGLEQNLYDTIVNYGDVSGRWDFKYKLTIALSDDPSKSYVFSGGKIQPNTNIFQAPNSFGSGIVAVEIADIENSRDDEYYGDDGGGDEWLPNWDINGQLAGSYRATRR